MSNHDKSAYRLLLVESHKSMSKLTGYDAKNVLHHWDSFGSPPFLVPQNGALAPGRWVEMAVTRMGSTMVYHGVYILHMVYHGIICNILAWGIAKWFHPLIQGIRSQLSPFSAFVLHRQAYQNVLHFGCILRRWFPFLAGCGVPNYDSPCIRQSFSAWKD